MYQCFVVCPFGNESRGEEEARLFHELKGLRKHIFKVAEARCKRKGFPARIVDAREVDHGRARILAATQESIDAADAVIVVLTANKPNVFLELGWAQGMWQNPILLMRETYELPTDISNDLVNIFTDAKASGADKAGATALAARVGDEIIKRIQLRRTKPFEHWPATTLARGAVDVYNRFSKAIPIDQWSNTIQTAEREIVIASTRMSRILQQAFFVVGEDKRPRQATLDKLLLQKALDGVQVTILMYHEDNITLGHLKRLQNDLQSIRDELRRSYLIWSTQRRTFETIARRSASSSGAFRVVQIRRRHLPFRVTLTERRALATIRFYTEIYNSGLCIDALCPHGEVDKENMPVYWQIKDELEFLIAENSEPSEQRYQDWAKTQAQA